MGSNGHQPYLHRVYKAILYSIGALLLLDSHVTVVIAAPRLSSEANPRRWRGKLTSIMAPPSHAFDVTT